MIAMTSKTTTIDQRLMAQWKLNVHFLACLLDTVTQMLHILLKQSANIADTKTISHGGLARIDQLI